MNNKIYNFNDIKNKPKKPYNKYDEPEEKFYGDNLDEEKWNRHLKIADIVLKLKDQHVGIEDIVYDKVPNHETSFTGTSAFLGLTSKFTGIAKSMLNEAVDLCDRLVISEAFDKQVVVFFIDDIWETNNQQD